MKVQAITDSVQQKYTAFLAELKRAHAREKNTRAMLAIENELTRLAEGGLTPDFTITTSPLPEEISKVRGIYEQQLMNSIEPLRKAYLKRLETLHHQSDQASTTFIQRELDRTRPTSAFATENSRIAIWNPDDH